MNEREYKKAVQDGKICSISGRPCKCESGEGCTRARVGSHLDPIPAKALRWARTAELHLAEAVSDLDRALDAVDFERRYPGPEWREARRLVAAALNYLRETNDG